MTCIDATGLSFRQVNEAIAAAKDADVLLEHALGQRYIGAGSAGRRIRIEGVPGNALGAYLDGTRIEVAGNAQDGTELDASPAYLGSLAANLIGAPLTDYQKAQLAIREEMPALSLLGMELADGTWVDPDDEAAIPQAYDDLSQISYLEFASKLR